MVREHIPLEQGLRRRNLLVYDCDNLRQSAYSIRTRIKKLVLPTSIFLLFLSETHSIRTRIRIVETQHFVSLRPNDRETIPLEQEFVHRCCIWIC